MKPCKMEESPKTTLIHTRRCNGTISECLWIYLYHQKPKDEELADLVIGTILYTSSVIVEQLNFNSETKMAGSLNNHQFSFPDALIIVVLRG
jgi:hypothetical protein